MKIPDEARMLAWLRGPAVRPDGAVLSWVNPAHPGYPYPEIAGLWLTVMALEAEVGDAEIARVLAWVLTEIDGEGRVGRAQIRYSFDSAIVVVGLCQALRRGLAVDRDLLERIATALLEDLRAGEVAWPRQPARWSTRASAHLGKLRWAFAELEAVLGPAERRSTARVEALLGASEVGLWEPDGRVRIRADDPRSYVHASCYALEGLLRAGERGREPLAAGARWLASIQAEDGSLPNWVAAPGEAIARPTDIIAQAARIWAQVDRERYAEPLARALAQLQARQTAGGGLSYLAAEIEPVDVNTWATLFAVQAVRWAAGRDMSAAIA
jgi:hypothetical protein